MALSTLEELEAAEVWRESRGHNRHAVEKEHSGYRKYAI